MNEDEQAAAERRRGGRASVIRSAKVICGASESVFDGLVLEQSSTGLQMDFGTVVNVPDVVTIQFAGGASFLARRAWTNGTRAGFALEGGQLLTAEMAERMRRFAHLLETQGVVIAVSTMRSARFLDHGVLRQLAEEAETAYMRLESFLQSQRR